MKKVIKIIVLILLLCVIVFALTGCANKDEKESKKVDPIVGSWAYGSGSFTYVFNEDGTGTYAGRSFTYKIEGDHISILYDGDSVPFETEYHIDGDTLNVIDSLGNDTLYKKVK